ncbi:hypothetical protein ANCCAN_19899 [Ancylostoma caninum]|uniref:Uncharacterized protein n=1 Tax=Ancylostoma caninum TaxID=29170 RepID=A0A368FTY4_ANCCA|nr:hypothetical protein ANCCAN_19899 [Ancylostoma caninum]
MDYDLINYKLEYQNIYERWYAVYYYLPNPLKITARTTAGGAVYECPVRLQVGKEYVVGHNGYFRFVLPFDSLKEQDRKLLEHKL